MILTKVNKQCSLHVRPSLPNSYCIPMIPKERKKGFTYRAKSEGTKVEIDRSQMQSTDSTPHPLFSGLYHFDKGPFSYDFQGK